MYSNSNVGIWCLLIAMLVLLHEWAWKQRSQLDTIIERLDQIAVVVENVEPPFVDK